MSTDLAAQIAWTIGVDNRLALIRPLLTAADLMADWLASVAPDFEWDEDGLGPEAAALLDAYHEAKRVAA